MTKFTKVPLKAGTLGPDLSTIAYNAATQVYTIVKDYESPPGTRVFDVVVDTRVMGDLSRLDSEIPASVWNDGAWGVLTPALGQNLRDAIRAILRQIRGRDGA